MAASRLWLASSSSSPFCSASPRLSAAVATLARATSRAVRKTMVLVFIVLLKLNLAPFCVFSSRQLSRFCNYFQSVAHTVHGLDPARLIGIRLQLGPQAGNVIVHRARGGKGGVAPDHIQKPFARDRLALRL